MPFLFTLSRPSDVGHPGLPSPSLAPPTCPQSGQLSSVPGAGMASSEAMFALVHKTGEEVKAQGEEGLCSGPKLPSQVTCSQVTMASDFAEDCP